VARIRGGSLQKNGEGARGWRKGETLGPPAFSNRWCSKKKGGGKNRCCLWEKRGGSLLERGEGVPDGVGGRERRTTNMKNYHHDNEWIEKGEKKTVLLAKGGEEWDRGPQERKTKKNN